MESVPGLENGRGQCSRCHASLPKLPVTPASSTGPGLPWPWVSLAQDSEKRSGDGQTVTPWQECGESAWGWGHRGSTELTQGRGRALRRQAGGRRGRGWGLYARPVRSFMCAADLSKDDQNRLFWLSEGKRLTWDFGGFASSVKPSHLQQ